VTAALDMTSVRIEDEFQVYEFTGAQLAYVTTRLDPKDRQRARWADFTLYRKDDGTYLFCQVSYSLVWHYLAGQDHVKKPEIVASGALGHQAVYCGVMPVKAGRNYCPAMSLAESRRVRKPERVACELPQYKIWTFPSAPKVIARMTVARHVSDGSASAATSEPMRNLLRQAALLDPAFQMDSAADKPVIRL
jgi:hypothetical protein